MLGLTGFLGLTRIPLCFWAHTDLTDPTVLLCGWEISQMLLRVGWLARIPLCFWAHTDLTDPTVFFVGGKSYRWFCVWAGSHGFHFAFGHTDLTDPTVLLCGWEISQMVLRVGLCVALRGTLLSLSRIYLSDPSDPSDPSDKSDLSDLSLIGRIGHFKKIIREICGICVRPRWTLWGAGDKITKNCVIWGVF